MEAEETVLKYEETMYRFEFHNVINILDTYIRQANKYWARNIAIADKNDDNELRKQVLVDCFHMVKTASLLSHPVVPMGTEKVAEYLNVDKDKFFSWDHAFETVYDVVDDPESHKLKEIEAKQDFFEKHPSQFAEGR